MTKIFDKKTEPVELLAHLQALTTNTIASHVVHDCPVGGTSTMSVLRSKPVQDSASIGVRDMVMYSCTEIKDGDMVRLEKAQGDPVLRLVFDVEAVGKKGKYAFYAVDAIPKAGVGHAPQVL